MDIYSLNRFADYVLQCDTADVVLVVWTRVQ